MDFYSYQYFVKQAQSDNMWKYAVFIMLLGALLIFIWKQFKSRDKMKYRDLVILVSLIIVFLVGIQINEYELGKTNQNNSTQMVSFMANIASVQHVDANLLRVNSKYLKDEMLIKIGDDFYQINMNSDLSSYKLEETFLINDQFREVEE